MPVFKFSVTNQLILNGIEKGLSFGSIPAVSLAAHALNITLVLQVGAEISACLLYLGHYESEDQRMVFVVPQPFFRVRITECRSNESLKPRPTPLREYRSMNTVR